MDVIKALLIHGMIVPGSAEGDHYGPVAIGKPDDRARSECRLRRGRGGRRRRRGGARLATVLLVSVGLVGDVRDLPVVVESHTLAKDLLRPTVDGLGQGRRSGVLATDQYQSHGSSLFV